MGLFSGLFSNKKGIKLAKQTAGAQQQTAMEAMEAADRERARGIAGEQAKMAVYGLLGQDTGTGNKMTAHTNVKNVDDPTSLFDKSGTGLSQPNQALWDMGKYSEDGRERLLGTPREGILDPDSYAAAISNSAAFRIQSKRVSESEQLLNQEGPAWDMLSSSVLGVINEGSALQLRDTMRKLKNQAAKGGSARRTAMFEANELIAGERAMRSRVQETWQANLHLFDAVRQNADRVAAGTGTFMQGLPLVNDSYRDAMQNTARMQIEASSMANVAIREAYDTRMTQQPVNFFKNLIEGTIMAGPSIVGGLVGGGGGAGASIEGVLSSSLKAASGGGYTPRSGERGGGGQPDYGSFVSDVGGMLKAGGDYFNEWREGGDDSPVGPYAGGYETDDWNIARG